VLAWGLACFVAVYSRTPRTADASSQRGLCDSDHALGGFDRPMAVELSRVHASGLAGGGEERAPPGGEALCTGCRAPTTTKSGRTTTSRRSSTGAVPGRRRCLTTGSACTASQLRGSRSSTSQMISWSSIASTRRWLFTTALLSRIHRTSSLPRAGRPHPRGLDAHFRKSTLVSSPSHRIFRAHFWMLRKCIWRPVISPRPCRTSCKPRVWTDQRGSLEKGGGAGGLRRARFLRSVVEGSRWIRRDPLRLVALCSMRFSSTPETRVQNRLSRPSPCASRGSCRQASRQGSLSLVLELVDRRARAHDPPDLIWQRHRVKGLLDDPDRARFENWSTSLCRTLAVMKITGMALS